MIEQNRGGAVAALLAEYEKVIIELQNVISDISDTDLIKVVDSITTNPDCKSIQAILTHVVSSGYSYCIYIRELRNKSNKQREKNFRSSVSEYKRDLDEVFKFTCGTFVNIRDSELEEFDNTKKIKTAWGQFYDLEQLFEHSIVHVLRHRRQIERFKAILKNQ